MRQLSALGFLCLFVAAGFAQDRPLPKTVAERTSFRETSRHADVLAFCEDLAGGFPNVNRVDFGTSHEGRPLPLLLLADPPVPTPEAAAKSGKPVVLVMANIHPGEVDGKEAVLALARDLSAQKSDLLKKIVLLIIPNLNPDGNERIDPKNRREQNGPPTGVGVRPNAQGFDLNRDFVKLESPEIRALVRLINKTNPLLLIDCHTTNGSYHRFTLTYDGPRHPTAPAIVNYGQKTMLPDVAEKVKQASGYDTFPYGNFSRDRSLWETYPSQPRYGVQYLTVRGRLALLSESYSYAPFEDRTKATYAFVKAACEHVAEHADAIKKATTEASKPLTKVPLRTRTVAEGSPRTVLGYEEVTKDGRRTRTDKTKDYSVTLVTKVEPTLEVDLPAAYLIMPGFPQVVQTLQRHGLKIDELREDIELDATAYTVTGIDRAARPFQGHTLQTLDVKPRDIQRMIPAGSILVRTSQPLGTLAAFLLEPQSEDGLAAWNFFDRELSVGGLYPVLRLNDAPMVNVGPPRPLPEDQVKDRPITATTQLGGGIAASSRRGGRGGASEWVDAEHFLQTIDGKPMKVHARTGRATPFYDPTDLKKSLEAVSGLSANAIKTALGDPPTRINKERTGALVDVGSELVFAYFDGRPALKFPKHTGQRELLTPSPQGTRIAYVKDGNLYAATAGEAEAVQLTNDGGGDVLNGKADWVYYEEIFGRNYRAYWWSPDGSRIAFMRIDDKPVQRFHITDAIPIGGRLETMNYPKTGEPNPLVKIGVVAASGGEVNWLDLSEYKPDDLVISHVGWIEGTNTPFAYVQNRTQTWLDFATWPEPQSKPVKLFHDSTPAWIESLGEPHWLKDGTFLVASERSGYKHLYHYAADGKLIGPVTKGDWEVQSVLRIDEKDQLVYLTGTKDTPTGSHLYRVKLDGSDFERLTASGGTHRVSLAPSGPLFIDRFSDDETPTQTAVFEIGRGKVRMLDTNPVYEREQYRWGRYERVKIPMKDGFILEGAIVYPPDFDAKKVYPVWLQTYAGPHAPTIRDGWNPRISDQNLARLGIIVFNVDPRSASGKGAVSAWTCYKQMGVQELKDLEEAVAWLSKNPWIDAKRIGLSGHSYGGFMTAYALTHSKVFSAGIAGAPPTDWRLYDSIYTERYMGLPKENKEGYEKTSVVKAAENLHGKLLLLHGMMDDNVHAQNSVQLIDALQRANKDFEVMFYPRSRHGIGGPHYQRLKLEFIKRALELPQ